MIYLPLPPTLKKNIPPLDYPHLDDWLLDILASLFEA